MTTRRFTRVRSSALIAGVALSVAALAGCGSDDDGMTAEEKFCAAGESLESDVSSLANLDIIAGGTDALNESVDAIEADLNALQESGSEVASEEIDALQSSFDELDDAVDALSDDIPGDNLTALSTAIRNIGTSASALYETLSTTCP
jgi:chromosome segregation ATPase